MTKKVIIAGVLWLLGSAFSVHAAASVSGDSTVQCGVGAELFKFTALNSAVSRINWDFMSIDTANVVPVQVDCNDADIAASRLLHEAYETIEMELAKGHGRYSAELLNVYACPPSQHRELLIGLRAAAMPLILDDEFYNQLRATKASTLFALVQEHVVGACAS